MLRVVSNCCRISQDSLWSASVLPGFSITENTPWAFDILQELGIKYDCSVFPAAHAHGGMPKGSPVPSIIKHGDASVREFPVTIKKFMGRNMIFSGGGYFRLLPYWLLHKWSHEAAAGQTGFMTPQIVHDTMGVPVMHDGIAMTRNVGYLLSYIHPRDLDGGQPMLEGLPWKRKFKSYVGTKGAAEKLRQYLKDFKFTDIQTAADKICWDKVPVVEV